MTWRHTRERLFARTCVRVHTCWAHASAERKKKTNAVRADASARTDAPLTMTLARDVVLPVVHVECESYQYDMT